jgi:hypothetical protein
MLSHHRGTSSPQKQRPHQTRIAAFCALLGLGFSHLCLPADAQTAGTGALGGNVSDPSGAAVTNAQVKATSETTGEMRTVKSLANGSYLIALLLPDLYEVEVVQSGFKTARFTQVRIAVAETVTLNMRLEIGAVSEQITVEAATGQLQTESSTLGRVTEGEQVRALPLVTRNYSQIIALNPGVAALLSAQTTPTPWDSATPAWEFTTDPDKTISICRLPKSFRSAGRAKIRRLNSARSSLTLSTTRNSVIRTWTSHHPHSGRSSARVSHRASSSLR